MTLACGYGRPVPSNRFLASRQDGALDATPALLVMYNAVNNLYFRDLLIRWYV